MMGSPGVMAVVADVQQPISTEIKIADGVFMKTMRVAKAATIVPQHAHAFAHMTVLVRGKVRVQIDGQHDGDYEAPDALYIVAHRKHAFMTLVDDTIMLCVHDIGTAEAVAFAEEHHLMTEV